MIELRKLAMFLALLMISLNFIGCAGTVESAKNRIPDETIIPAEVLNNGKSSEELAFLTASELAEKIRSRQVTSLQVVDAYLARIAKHNSKLRSIVTIDVEKVRQRAKEADVALSKGEIWGPLHGVPVTIKDNIATSGMRTTNSFELTENHIPDFDAPVVERLKNAGAIILGKTNLSLLGFDFQSNSPLFGIGNNPWDTSRTPGGSTGGGAAAVAACLSPLEIGNDIAGSVRIPAAFCGIYGIKPTEHLVSMNGIAPGLPEKEFKSMRYLFSYGPLARSIKDLKISLSIIQGPDKDDPAVPDIKLSDQKKNLKDLRIAWSDNFGDVPVTEDTKAAIAKLASDLSKSGAHVERVSPPDLDFIAAWNTYGEILDYELGCYTPVIARFCMCVANMFYSNEIPMSKMSCPMSYEKFLVALTKRDQFMSSMNDFLSRYDVFLCPVHVTSAFRHIMPDKYFGPYAMYDTPIMVDDKPLNYWVANSSYTTIFNLTGNPSVSMPVAYDRNGLPIGIQVVGKRWHDLDLLNNAEEIDKVAGAFKHPPGFK